MGPRQHRPQAWPWGIAPHEDGQNGRYEILVSPPKAFAHQKQHEGHRRLEAADFGHNRRPQSQATGGHKERAGRTLLSLDSRTAERPALAGRPRLSPRSAHDLAERALGPFGRRADLLPSVLQTLALAAAAKTRRRAKHGRGARERQPGLAEHPYDSAAHLKERPVAVNSL